MTGPTYGSSYEAGWGECSRCGYRRPASRLVEAAGAQVCCPEDEKRCRRDARREKKRKEGEKRG